MSQRREVGNFVHVENSKNSKTKGWIQVSKNFIKTFLAPSQTVKASITSLIYSSTVIKHVQSFFEEKATNASENFRAMKGVVKSEEFKEIRTNYSKGRYESNPNKKFHKCPAIQRFQNAANDTIYLFKSRKSEWF